MSDPYVVFLDRQAQVFRDQRRAGLARLGLKPGMAVLDAGCGPGTDAFDLEDLVMPGGRITGVDASEKMIAAACRRAADRCSQAEFVLGDVCALDSPDGTFDLARSVLLLLHVDEPLAAVREMARVVRPGGQVVSIDVDHQMDSVDATDLALAERVFRGRFADLRNPRIGRQLRGLFVAAGLVDIQVEVLTQVSTSWSHFTALSDKGGASLFDVALTREDASREELDSLKADLEVRDSEGRFFACAVRMRCSGIKP